MSTPSCASIHLLAAKQDARSIGWGCRLPESREEQGKAASVAVPGGAGASTAGVAEEGTGGQTGQENIYTGTLQHNSVTRGTPLCHITLQESLVNNHLVIIKLAQQAEYPVYGPSYCEGM